MPKYSRRHYIEIGNLLKNASMKDQEDWIAKFRMDNPRFDEMRFRNFLKMR